MTQSNANDDAVEALRPFATMTRVLETRARLTFGRALKDDDILFESSGEADGGILTVGDFRKARAALAKHGE